MVSVKVACSAPVLAMALKTPEVWPELRAGVTTKPRELVMAVKVVPPPAKVAEAPAAGSVKVTETLFRPTPLASSTLAVRGWEKAVPVEATCDEPEKATIATGGFTILVRLKLAEREPLAA